MPCIEDVEVIFSIVGYPSDVKEVYEVVIEKAKKGTILVDMTTSSPTLAIELYQKAKSKGLSMLDAPVTGGDLGAINGTLSIMVGGDETSFNKILPLFQLMGTKVTYMTGGSANSWQAQINGQKMINHDYKPGFFVKHYLKDLKLVLEEKGSLKLEVVEKVERAYQLLSDHGFSEEGTQSIIEYYLQKMM